MNETSLCHSLVRQTNCKSLPFFATVNKYAFVLGLLSNRNILQLAYPIIINKSLSKFNFPSVKLADILHVRTTLR